MCNVCGNKIIVIVIIVIVIVTDAYVRHSASVS